MYSKYKKTTLGELQSFINSNKDMAPKCFLDKTSPASKPKINASELFNQSSNLNISMQEKENDFENFMTLEQDTTNDRDWWLMQGPTGSQLTGPQGDHTTGCWIYYYAEASTNGVGFPYQTFISYTLQHFYHKFRNFNKSCKKLKLHL